ncbi:hypothetical protein CL628_02590 [bacterium]|nr:hypothetical protein [bacterium]
MLTADAAVLGLIQGITEFIPVSSSGHLLAARLFFGISDDNGTAFDAFLHLGTLAAVLLYYWRVWWGIIRGFLSTDAEGRDKRELAGKLALATVPAVVVGYLFQAGLADRFRTPTSLAVGLIITAVVLWWFDRLAQQRGSGKMVESDVAVTQGRASYRDALVIGLAQVIALLPGVSRSGVTMGAGRGRGMSRKQAASFSFLMSAPIIAGAGLASFGELVTGAMFASGDLLVGFVVSFVSGLIAIYALLKIVEKMSFTPFVIYLILLAAAVVYVR